MTNGEIAGNELSTSSVKRSNISLLLFNSSSTCMIYAPGIGTKDINNYIFEIR